MVSLGPMVTDIPGGIEQVKIQVVMHDFVDLGRVIRYN